MKIKLQKIVGNLLDYKLRKLYMNETITYKFFRHSQVIENPRQYFFSEQIFYVKQSLVAADISLLCLSTAKERESQIFNVFTDE